MMHAAIDRTPIYHGREEGSEPWAELVSAEYEGSALIHAGILRRAGLLDLVYPEDDVGPSADSDKVELDVEAVFEDGSWYVTAVVDLKRNALPVPLEHQGALGDSADSAGFLTERALDA